MKLLRGLTISMISVVLCGGKGLRYGNKPKGLAMIGNRPIIHHVLEIYAQQGFKEFVIILGYKSEDIEKYFKQINHDYIIHFANKSENMNKGGSLKLVEHYLNENENMFCNYCDCLANIDLKKLLNSHLISNNILTLTAIKPISEFGIIEFGNNNKIIGFEEKPLMDKFVNGGFFVINKKIFDYILRPETELETEIFEELIKNNKLGGYKHFGKWYTLNSKKDEEFLNNLYNKSMMQNTELDWYKI